MELFKKTNLIDTVNLYFTEQELKVDKKKVMAAAMKIIGKLVKNPDKTKVNGIVNSAVKKGKDTEDAISMIQDLFKESVDENGNPVQLDIEEINNFIKTLDGLTERQKIQMSQQMKNMKGGSLFLNSEKALIEIA